MKLEGEGRFEGFRQGAPDFLEAQESVLDINWLSCYTKIHSWGNVSFFKVLFWEILVCMYNGNDKCVEMGMGGGDHWFLGLLNCLSTFSGNLSKLWGHTWRKCSCMMACSRLEELGILTKFLLKLLKRAWIDSAPCSPKKPNPTPHCRKKGTTWSSNMWSLGVMVARGKESR